MQENNTFMKTRPVFSLLVSMSVPMMLSMLIQSLYNIVDSIYVSQLGTDALTAVSLAYPLQNAILSVAVGIGVGISSAISIHLGAENQEKADRAATIGIGLTVFHCVLFIIGGLVITRPFLSLFTDNPAVLDDSCAYTYIVLCLSFGSLLQIAFEKIFQSIGQMKITMCLLIAGCVINIILDPILIFGLLGFPALGVAGAAIATVIGQISAFLLYIVVYLRKPCAIQIRRKYLRFDRSIIRQIYSVGIPSSIMMLLPSVLISILNSILAAFSEVYVAVLGVYFKLQTFIYMPANGIVQGMRPVIGYNYGAGETRRVRSAIRYSLACAAVLMLLGTLLSLLIPEQIFALFDADSELMKAGVTALRIISLGFLVSSVGVIYSGTFEAIGNGRNSLIISLLRQFVITIPLSFLLSKVWGPSGVWLSFPAGELCASITGILLLNHYENGILSPFLRSAKKERQRT
ncbi:MAG TPA: MATE family efflux transporter [Candidatus Mediterraneibacter stercorigallinarum]|uniref:Probable multidrug resistance protein NorM n=1 Tax=Candidatus Mediterraneibacter stercorigallinarum TaxID=2838686 RepID=A0A9D2DBV7_9FIRM|nr:MATE family efflux transporter [Candidatus Mediterraneibacter stercorigallinarum]